MTKLQTQISKLEKRLQTNPDPLLCDVLASLRELERINTVEGALDFFEQTYCGRFEAAEITGKPYASIRQYCENYRDFPDSRRIKLPNRTISSGKGRVSVIVKKSLKDLS